MNGFKAVKHIREELKDDRKADDFLSDIELAADIMSCAARLLRYIREWRRRRERRARKQHQ